MSNSYYEDNRMSMINSHIFTDTDTHTNSKDLIIERLKEQLYQSKHNQYDFRLLSKQFEELQFNYDQLQREKDQTQQQYRNNYENDCRRIINYKQQLDLLNQNLIEKQELLEQSKKDLSFCKEVNGMIGNENIKIKQEIQKYQDAYLNLNKVQEQQLDQIDRLENEKRGLKVQLDQVTRDNDELVYKNSEIQSYCDILKRENEKLEYTVRSFSTKLNSQEQQLRENDKQIYLVQQQKQEQQLEIQFITDKLKEQDQIIQSQDQNCKRLQYENNQKDYEIKNINVQLKQSNKDLQGYEYSIQENEQIIKQSHQENSQQQLEIQHLKDDCQKYQRNIKSLQESSHDQISRYQMNEEKYLRELDKLKGDMKIQEDEFYQKIEELNRQLQKSGAKNSELQSQNEQIKIDLRNIQKAHEQTLEVNQQFDQQSSYLNNLSYEYLQHIDHMQQKINKINDEDQQLNDLLTKRNQTCKELKYKTDTVNKLQQK